MQPSPALIVTEADLDQLLQRAGQLAAINAINQLRADLVQDPDEVCLRKLRTYLEDRTSIAAPRECWASSKVIRAVDPGRNGRLKSVSWFQNFKRQSGLGGCPSRRSSSHRGLQEWTFEDIANAWGGDHRSYRYGG